jgi:hypothetical protein
MYVSQESDGILYEKVYANIIGIFVGDACFRYDRLQ